MKRILVLMMFLPMLYGCVTQIKYESVEDVYSSVLPLPGEICVSLPMDAVALTASTDTREQLYFCDGYTVTVQTLNGGNLDRSLREITGFGKSSLTVFETSRDGMRCVSCVWTSIGETGDQVGRLVLLDDGDYHYAVSVMADADLSGSLGSEWDDLLGCVTVARIGS